MFQTIRPVVSRKKRGFSAHFRPGGAVLPPRILTFSKAKCSIFFEECPHARIRAEKPNRFSRSQACNTLWMPSPSVRPFRRDKACRPSQRPAAPSLPVILCGHSLSYFPTVSSSLHDIRNAVTANLPDAGMRIHRQSSCR